MFKNLDTAIVYVGDIKKSKQFYVEILKFNVVDDQGKFVSFKVSGDDKTRVALNGMNKKDHHPGFQTLILASDNIQKVYDYLKQKQVKFILELVHKHWGDTFIIEDPDGNKIEVVER